MANGWQAVPLGEFLAQRKEFFIIDDFTHYKRVRVQSHGKGIVLRDEVTGAEIKTKKQQAARTGEFLVAEIDAKVGGFGIVPPELDGAVVSSHYFLFQIDENKCSQEWLNWFVRYNSLEEQTKAQGSTNYAAIRPNDVLNFEIPLPPLTEQRRIVSRIEALAARVAEVQSLRREASEETEILFYKTTQEAFSQYSDNMTKIGDAFRVTTGGTPSRANPIYWEGNVKWVSSGEVAFSKIKDTKEKITELGVAESNAKVYPPNTVLIAMIGQGKTRGQCAILDCHAATNQNVAGIHAYQTEHLPNTFIGGSDRAILKVDYLKLGLLNQL